MCTSGDGGDGGAVTGQRAGKPLTTVQVCVSTFVNMTSLKNVFTGNLRISPILSMATKNTVLAQHCKKLKKRKVAK